jgi:hypothetical protein
MRISVRRYSGKSRQTVMTAAVHRIVTGACAMLYRGMDRAQLDAAYNNSAAVPERDAIVADWAARSARVRLECAGHIDLAYGDIPRERLDLFLAADPQGPRLGLSMAVNRHRTGTPHNFGLSIWFDGWNRRSAEASIGADRYPTLGQNKPAESTPCASLWVGSLPDAETHPGPSASRAESRRRLMLPTIENRVRLSEPVLGVLVSI